MKTIRSGLYICLASVLWGGISLLFRPLTNLGFTSLQIVFLRVFIAAIGMATYIAFRDPSLFRIRLNDIWLFIGSGIVSLAFFNFCYFQTINRLSSSVAASLLYTAPVFVMVLSIILFQEKITMRKVFAVISTVSGCVLVTGVLETTTTPDGTGIFLGICSGIGYALYSIFGTLALRRYSTQTITFYTFLFASVGVLPICKPDELLSIALTAIPQTLMLSLGIGIGICLLPYWLYTKGLEHTRASNASVIATIEPIVATLIGCLAFHDAMSFTKIVGISLIILSICILNISSFCRIKK